MNRRHFLAAACVVLMSLIGAYGEEPASEPATRPTSNPTTQNSDPRQIRIGQLIQQLGDESEKVRDTAGKELLKIGEPARQALIDAQNNPIPEIRDRAAILLSSLDSNKIDATPAGLFTTQEAIISSSKNITDEDNSLVIETEKKVVKIHLYHRLSGSVSVYFKDPDVRSNNIALNFDDWRNVKKTNPPVGRMLEEYISEYLPMD